MQLKAFLNTTYAYYRTAQFVQFTKFISQGKIVKNLKYFIVLLFSISLFGCAGGAKEENMVYLPEGSPSYDEALKKEIDLGDTSGGKETNPLWSSQISNDSFSAAVKTSLAEHGLYSESGRYQLNISLIQVEQPLFGLNMTVITTVRYTLKDTTDSSELFNHTVTARYTATVGDAFVGTERLRLANEGSGRENIKSMLQKLSELNVKEVQVSLTK